LYLIKNNNTVNDSDIEKDYVAAQLFEAISHPTRILILRILSEKSLGFAELKRKLGISSSGNLAHHLDKLSNLVETDENGDYRLSDQGRDAFLAVRAHNAVDTDWLAETHVVVSALVFYGLCVTIMMITGWAKTLEAMGDLYLGQWAKVLAPAGAMISTVIFYIIHKALFMKRLHKESSPRWRHYEVREK
jgi:DNA-binding HxlR family transcriptional regulator